MKYCKKTVAGRIATAEPLHATSGLLQHQLATAFFCNFKWIGHAVARLRRFTGFST
jgi:hypothetical protein